MCSIKFTSWIKKNKNIWFILISTLIVIQLIPILKFAVNSYNNNYLITPNADAIAISDSVYKTQKILSLLPLKIAEHDYKSFNADIKFNDTENNEHIFHKFSVSSLLNAVRNKTIIFFGDSTVLRFYSWTIYCLANRIRNGTARACNFDHTLFNSHWRDWNTKIRGTSIQFPNVNTQYLGSDGSFKAIFPEINVTLYNFEQRNDRNISELFRLYDSFIAYSPDIIYWHPSGLHLLHLEPQRKMESNAFGIIHSFHENMLKIYEVSAAIQSMKGRMCLIYRATSPMCTVRDGGAYKIVRDYYKHHYSLHAKGALVNMSNDHSEVLYQSAIRNCSDKYRAMNITNATEICRDWTETNERGIPIVNKLMQHFVVQAQAKIFGGFNRLYYYDRYNLFHIDKCGEEASDSCHWLPSYGADAMLFTNFITFGCE